MNATQDLFVAAASRPDPEVVKLRAQVEALRQAGADLLGAVNAIAEDSDAIAQIHGSCLRELEQCAGRMSEVLGL